MYNPFGELVTLGDEVLQQAWESKGAIGAAGGSPSYGPGGGPVDTIGPRIVSTGQSVLRLTDSRNWGVVSGFALMGILGILMIVFSPMEDIAAALVAGFTGEAETQSRAKGKDFFSSLFGGSKSKSAAAPRRSDISRLREKYGIPPGQAIEEVAA